MIIECLIQLKEDVKKLEKLYPETLVEVPWWDAYDKEVAKKVWEFIMEIRDYIMDRDEKKEYKAVIEYFRESLGAGNMKLV